MKSFFQLLREAEEFHFPSLMQPSVAKKVDNSPQAVLKDTLEKLAKGMQTSLVAVASTPIPMPIAYRVLGYEQTKELERRRFLVPLPNGDFMIDQDIMRSVKTFM